MRFLLALVIYGAGLGLLAWLGGLGYFLHGLPQPPQPLPIRKADGIVVLTGGALRVQEGLELMERGLGERLLISGVGRGVTVEELLAVHATGRTKEALRDLHAKGKVTLGYAALNTIGNAVETADWARKYKLESLYLVTGYYHLPRAMLELANSLPEAEVMGYPVFPPAKGSTAEQGLWARWRLLLGEYHKYLLGMWRHELLGHGVKKEGTTRG